MRPLPPLHTLASHTGFGGTVWHPRKATNFHEVGDRLLTPSPIWLEFPGEDGGPTIRMVVEVLNGVPRCTASLLESAEGGREVKPRDHRFLAETLEGKVLAAVTLCSLRFDDDDQLGAPNGLADLKDSVSVAHSVRRANRHAPSEDHLRRVAEVYNKHTHGGLKAVMQAFQMPKSTAARRIRAARAAGLIEEREQ